MGAHPRQPDEARAYAAGNRLKRLCTGTLAAPSHARVRILHRSNSASYPISSARPVPDLPAGRFLHKMAIGPKHETWRRRPPASLQAGRRGATTGFAPPVTAQRWTCIDHGAAEGALPAAKIDAFHFWLRWIRGSRIPPSHGQKRSVGPSPPPRTLSLPLWMAFRLVFPAIWQPSPFPCFPPHGSPPLRFHPRSCHS